MVKINNKFLRYDVFGEKIAMKLCAGWECTCYLTDRFGNGFLLFKHREFCDVPVAFTEIKVEDIVEMEYFKLCEVVREY